MDHVSVICTYMWRRARAGLIAPHRAELTAVRDMGNLYTWSAALVDYLEKNYGPGAIGMEEGEREGAGGRTGPVPASAVGHMAMKLCRHFGNSEGVRACESICAELAELAHRKRGERATAGHWAPFGGFGGHSSSA
jgi:hypothetical protein